VITKGPSLLGRDMLAKFSLLRQDIHKIQPEMITAESIINKFPDLFDDSIMGKFKEVQVSLRVKEDHPVFIKPRTILFAIRTKYEKSLAKLESEDIIEKIDFSEWASPTVLVLKPNGDTHICGDYSVTINKSAVLEHYPIPTLEELFHKLAGGQKFTKLDLSQAYHQIELHPKSSKFTTINTHKGLYQYKRLTYGINSAVSIFQRAMENVLRDLVFMLTTYS
jgi:hypothetical protein